MERVDILLVNTGDKDFDGVSQLEYNWWKSLKSHMIHFDFLTLAHSTFDLRKEEILSNKSNIYDFKSTGNKITRNLKFSKYIIGFFKENQYDIVHINSGMSFRTLIVLIILFFFNTKVILHGHSSVEKNNYKKIFIRKLTSPLNYYLSTKRVAVSSSAAETFFPKKYIQQNKVKVIMNGIDVNQFHFNKKIRQDMRLNYSIDNNTLVLGFIGRMIYQKNPEFALQVYLDLLSTNKSSVLFMVGSGPLLDKLKKIVNIHSLSDKVYFLENKKNIADFYQMFDVLIMPSHYEGLPLVGIESQAAGLITLISTNVTEETIITPLAERLDTRDTVTWVNKIKNINPTLVDRTIYFENIYNGDFNQSNANKKIYNLYRELVNY